MSKRGFEQLLHHRWIVWNSKFSRINLVRIYNKWSILHFPLPEFTSHSYSANEFKKLVLLRAIHGISYYIFIKFFNVSFNLNELYFPTTAKSHLAICLDYSNEMSGCVMNTISEYNCFRRFAVYICFCMIYMNQIHIASRMNIQCELDINLGCYKPLRF